MIQISLKKRERETEERARERKQERKRKEGRKWGKGKTQQISQKPDNKNLKLIMFLENITFET